MTKKEINYRRNNLCPSGKRRKYLRGLLYGSAYEPPVPVRTEDLKSRLLELFPSLDEARQQLAFKLEQHKNIISNSNSYNTGCWEWTGSKNQAGYGAITLTNGSIKYTIRVHRISYFVRYFEFPQDGLCVLHKCDNPKCFNPEHLCIGTQKQNMKDAVNKGRVRNGYSNTIEYDYRNLN